MLQIQSGMQDMQEPVDALEECTTILKVEIVSLCQGSDADASLEAKKVKTVYTKDTDPDSAALAGTMNRLFAVCASGSVYSMIQRHTELPSLQLAQAPSYK